MFNHLAEKLQKTFDGLTGRGLIRTEDVDAACREIRVALLEADVALPAVKHLIKMVKERAVGEEVLKSVTPGQQIVKVVNDALVELLGEAEPLNLNAQPPAVILMAGLQGSGKTTTAGKLAKRLKEREGKKVLLASTDIYRPAAQEQLATLAEQSGAAYMPIKAGEKPASIAKRALKEAKEQGAQVLIMDTAGRLELDDALMAELVEVRSIVNPSETLLVADSLTGQVAVQIATAFNEAVNITGIVLTRADGDGRGGAALSMRHVTGRPIKFLGTGEHLGGLEEFRPEGLASRILGQGDVVSLVEQAAEAANVDDMMAFQEKLMSGKGFDLVDYKKQMVMIRKMASGQGGMMGLLKLLPGVGKAMKQVDPSKLDEKVMVHQIAVIDSMTPQERKNPKILNARRRSRIAGGAGVEVSVVNKVIKSHQQMQGAMKKMQKMGGPAAMMQMLNNKGGMPKF